MYKSDCIRVGRNQLENPDKEYRGERSNGECFVTVNGRALDHRFDLCFHSPDGFEWGHDGSGTAQLALSLLADCLSDDGEALRFCQEFKRKTVAGFPREGWSLTGKEIDEVLNTLRDEACT